MEEKINGKKLSIKMLFGFGFLQFDTEKRPIILAELRNAQQSAVGSARSPTSLPAALFSALAPN